MILCNIAYSIVTEESAADGDVAESGMLEEGTEMTFRELVDWMRGCEVSAWPATGSTREWIRQDQGETRAWFEDGEREERTLHYSRENPQRKARYWALAMRAAGLVR